MNSDPAAATGALPPGRTLGRALVAARMRLQTLNEVALVGILLALCIGIGIKNPAFWSEDNLQNVARSASFTLIVAVAATLVLVSGSLDLSVGSVYALGGAIAALAMTGGVPIVLAMVLGLLAGAAVGLINGFLVEWLRVPALIATLGTLYAIRGAVLVITEGAPVYPLPASFLPLGQGDIAGVPTPAVIAAGVCVLGHFCLTRSVFGRRVHAVGSNEAAAHLAGVAIRRVRLLVFVLSGMAAALGGMLVAARISSAQTNAGTGLELSVIAAVVIGGTSLFGGTGSVFGTVLGTLLISVIANGMVLTEVNPFYQEIVIGTIIVIAVAIDGLRRRRLAEMSLELREVGKSYGSSRVLDAVSFRAELGEVIAVCGENGAGKSTLMKILTGLLPSGSYDGSVMLEGSELHFAGPRDAERSGVAILPQELVYYPELTAAENVLAGSIPSTLGMIDRSTLDRKAGELCRSVGLSVPVRTQMRRLETAQRQLVCAARALAFDPRVLVLDEPTAALTRTAAEHLLDVVRDYAARGNTVVYVSHHLEEVQRLADRVMVLRNGRVVVAPRAGMSVGEIVAAMIGDLGEREPAELRPVDRSGAPVLRAEVRSLRRGQQTVLEDVSFEVWRGEVVGIAGLAGSGREALLRALAGSPPGRARGEVEIGGRRLPLRSPARLRRAGLSFLPDDRLAEGILPLAPLSENVLLGYERFAAVAGVRRPARERDAVGAVLAEHEVRPADPDLAIGKLSGGNQQKALLARAGFSQPAVTLLAEPTRGVDVGARAAIYDSIRAAADDGAAFVVSSGDVSELTAVCDRVLMLWRGRAVGELSSSQMNEGKVLAAINGELDAVANDGAADEEDGI